MTFDRRDDVAGLETLAAVGYLRVSIRVGAGGNKIATVTEVTGAGISAANRFIPEESDGELEPTRKARAIRIVEFAAIALLALVGAIAVARFG